MQQPTPLSDSEGGACSLGRVRAGLRDVLTKTAPSVQTAAHLSCDSVTRVKGHSAKAGILWSITLISWTPRWGQQFRGVS